MLLYLYGRGSLLLLTSISQFPVNGEIFVLVICVQLGLIILYSIYVIFLCLHHHHPHPHVRMHFLKFPLLNN